MYKRTAHLEMTRWGYVNLPGVIFEYSKELDLDIEDIGILTAMFFSYQHSKPLYHTGIEAGKILQLCPCLTKQKLSRKLAHLEKLGVIRATTSTNGFADKIVCIEPLMEKLENLVVRDHPCFAPDRRDTHQQPPLDNVLKEYQEKIEQLELQLQDQRSQETRSSAAFSRNTSFKKVADFIAKKTGGLLGVAMTTELRRWLEDMAFTPEFLLCMLELCFERQMNNPKEITRIASDLKRFSVNNVEGLESYFTRYVDGDKNYALRNRQFDPELMEFGTYTGIDMSAEARKKVYYKWRYDWGFSHALIMKAGEIMCQRTKNGGLEYLDSVLNDWMSKEIRQVEDVEKEIQNFKAKRRQHKAASEGAGKAGSQSDATEYEIYIPPDLATKTEA